MARIDFAWELGGHTGHVSPMIPIATALKARGHQVRFLLKDERAGADLETAGLPRQGAPNWVGPPVFEDPLNFGEILHNFGYHDPKALRQLLDAWRDRLAGAHLLIGNSAPSALLAAHTLGIPSFEISQGCHAPPRAFPSPPLKPWQPVSRQRLEDADRRVLGSMAAALADFRAQPIGSLGDLYQGRTMLLTYPELDIYSPREPAEYYGVTDSAQGASLPPWPAGAGPRIFSYLYNYYDGLPLLLETLKALDAPTLALCRGIDGALRERYAGSCIYLSDEPMAVLRLLPECDAVICHGSHQMTAQALLAGKPVLLLPTQLEQFLIARRVVRFGAGLGIAPDVRNVDFPAALHELEKNSHYADKAEQFRDRYRAHRREAALATIAQRCEASIA